MNNNFYFLGYEDFTSNDGNRLIRISLLDYNTKNVHNIYKVYSKELITKLDTKYKLFANITNDVTFVIKRDGKISLDIK